MYISWEEIYKEITKIELSMTLQLGQLEFQRTISPTWEVIEETKG